VFFTQTAAGSQFHKAVPCLEKYAGMSQSLLDQFVDYKSTDPNAATTGYLCPEPNSVRLSNNLANPGSGYEYANMVLTYCDQAAVWLGYVDTNCSNDRSVSEMYFGMYNFQFDTKYVGQYFEPVQYKQNQTMSYFSQDDMLFKLAYMTPNTTVQAFFSVDQTLIHFDSNTFWPQWGDRPVIEYYRLLADEQSEYASSQQIVELTLEQGSTEKINYTIDTVWTMLGLLGGVMIALWFIWRICINSYEEYAFE
jgi:hypothetical protein